MAETNTVLLWVVLVFSVLTFLCLVGAAVTAVVLLPRYISDTADDASGDAVDEVSENQQL